MMLRQTPSMLRTSGLLHSFIKRTFIKPTTLCTKGSTPTLENSDTFGELNPKVLYRKRASLSKKNTELYKAKSTDKNRVKKDRSNNLKESKLSHSYYSSSVNETGNFEREKLHEINVNSSGQTEKHENIENEFGTLDREAVRRYATEKEAMKEDQNDKADHHIRLSNFGRKETQYHYGRKVEKLAKKGMIYEAIEMLERHMIEEDRVMPLPYNFTVVIGALGRVGYTKKAFQLYSKMKKMGLQPEDATYTALFNACGNSPWKEDGLRRAQHLHLHLQDINHTPNLITYKAMIKAYGKCGDIQTAFSLVDDISDHGHAVDQEVFAHLLIACISDRDAGLKHAIEVWRRMRKRRVKPKTVQYNLLLRAVRDCNIGDPELANQLLGRSALSTVNQDAVSKVNQDREKKPLLGLQTDQNERKSMLQIKPVSHEDVTGEEADRNVNLQINIKHSEGAHKYLDDIEITEEKIHPNFSSKEDNQRVSSQISTDRVVKPDEASVARKSDTHLICQGPSDLQPVIPNLLNPRVRDSGVIGLAEVDQPWQRLALLGGVSGFLSHMAKDEAKPDIKTFTQLLAILPGETSAENDLLDVMHNHQVEPDVDFFSALIRKRNIRSDFSGAKEVMSMIYSRNLVPNVQTYGCLAMGCGRRQDGMTLLEQLKSDGIQPSVVICGILVKSSGQDFVYKLQVLQQMKVLNILPNTKLIEHIEKAVREAKEAVVRKEKGESVKRVHKRESFKTDFRNFMRFYKSWLLEGEMDLDEHPWAAYRRPHPTTLEELHEEAVRTDLETYPQTR